VIILHETPRRRSKGLCLLQVQVTTRRRARLMLEFLLRCLS